MVKVDSKKCFGCGACASIAPDCFDIGANGKAIVKKDCKCEEACKRAIEACPAGAISK